MSKRSQAIEIIRLVTLLMGGLGMASAYAQAPTFSPPNLPPIPGAPQPPSAPQAPAAPDTTHVPNADNATGAAKTDGVLADLSAIQKGNGTPQLTTTNEPNATPTPAANAIAPANTPAAAATTVPPSLADLPPPIAPESSDKATARPTVTTLPAIVADKVGAPPPLNLAGTSTTALPSLQPTATPTPTSNQPPPMLLPPPSKPKKIANKPADATAVAAAGETGVKTWQTKLKPTSEAWHTTFNYRRVLLPAEIYRTSYDGNNSGLPVRTTREDYVRLLFAAATRNDINGTRALLNAGTDINATDGYGITPLAAARQAGAYDTAALLMARGAR